VNNAEARLIQLIQSAGFVSSSYDPFDYVSRTPRTITINSIVFRNVKEIYTGEGGITINRMADVFYHDIHSFHIGGMRRI
jgi:hypothetical protein